jgi:predicted nucleotidyltransferase
MAMIRLQQDFKDFLNLLNSHSVEYLVIGGYAVGYHGYPRATGDIDIWISNHDSNAKKLVNVLIEFGFDVPGLSEKMFLEKGKVIRMGFPPVRIEILTSISGVNFQECFSTKLTDQIDGITVNLISLENLKTNKKASGRFKDLDDLENLQ